MVTDITVDGILGLDFLKKDRSIIDLNSNTLRLNNENNRISCEGALGCFCVVTADDICIPPRSEMIEEARIPGRIHLEPQIILSTQKRYFLRRDVFS